MCGIAGIVAPGGVTAGDVRPLGATLAHRGPDACGAWSDGC
jgi:asparagine synthetase B (glutamine-hydrolysing)